MTAVTRHLVGTVTTGARVRISLRWTPKDPHAVSMTLYGTDAQPVEWLFAWTLLEDGLHALAGVGDVRVYPASPSRTAIVLDGSHLMVVQVPNAELQGFLADTWIAEPPPAPDFVPAEWVWSS